MSRCIIIGSAPAWQPNLLKELLKEGDVIFCADGGLKTALEMGITPSLVAGDFDSYSGAMPREMEVIRLPVCKDDTDLMFCVKEALRRGYEDFLILGATGGRLDHTYGNLGILLYLARRGVKNLMADEHNQALVLGRGSFTIQGKRGSMISVFPYGCEECCVSYDGLAYPLDYGTLSAEEPVGVSNRFIENEAKITVHNGWVLVVLSREE